MTSCRRGYRSRASAICPSSLADDWRGRYAPSMDRVRSGEIPWRPLDQLHRESLEELLPSLGLADLDEGIRRELVLAWHRLDPWPDVLPGMRRLAASHVLAPLSNGWVCATIEMVAEAGGAAFWNGPSSPVSVNGWSASITCPAGSSRPLYTDARSLSSSGGRSSCTVPPSRAARPRMSRSASCHFRLSGRDRPVPPSTMAA